MGRTYTWQDGLTIVGGQGFRSATDTGAVMAVNDAQQLIWEAYDWRETMVDLPPFALTQRVQDYGDIVSAVPADFLALRKAYLVDTESWRRTEIKVRNDNVPETVIEVLPEMVGYIPERAAFRVWNRPPAGIASTQYLIDGRYKKRPVKITAETLNTLIPWDDRHFRAVRAALQWALTGDAAEQSKMQRYQVALSQIHAMAVSEGLSNNDPTGLSPENSLAPNW